jgi:hypothetical protein
MTLLFANGRPDEDAQFFMLNPDRKARIRYPRKVLSKDRQRGVRYVDECEGEFWSLGDHDKSRRRIILTRVDVKGEPLKDNHLLKLPLLSFSDEMIEDSDEILLPLIREIMTDAARKMS